MASRLTKTIAWLAAKGWPSQQVPEDTKAHRLAICESNKCEKWIKTTRQCGHCLCLMDVKASLVIDPVASLKKGTATHVKCPLDFWGEYQ